jgi:hypothetical protein
MTRSLLIGATLLATALVAGVPQPADAFRGGGFAAGGFHGGGAWGAGGAGGFHAGGVDAWHAGGVGGAWGGTWHVDGWHGGGAYGGGFHGPVVVNHYYGGGCWNCGAAAIAGAAIGAAAVGYAVGSLVTTVPPGCAYQAVAGTNYYVCNGTWFQPYYGNNGLYYRVVPPM